MNERDVTHLIKEVNVLKDYDGNGQYATYGYTSSNISFQLIKCDQNPKNVINGPYGQHVDFYRPPAFSIQYIDYSNIFDEGTSFSTPKHLWYPLFPWFYRGVWLQTEVSGDVLNHPPYTLKLENNSDENAHLYSFKGMHKIRFYSLALGYAIHDFNRLTKDWDIFKLFKYMRMPVPEDYDGNGHVDNLAAERTFLSNWPVTQIYDNTGSEINVSDTNAVFVYVIAICMNRLLHVYSEDFLYKYNIETGNAFYIENALAPNALANIYVFLNYDGVFPVGPTQHPLGYDLSDPMYDNIRESDTINLPTVTLVDLNGGSFYFSNKPLVTYDSENEFIKLYHYAEVFDHLTFKLVGPINANDANLDTFVRELFMRYPESISSHVVYRGRTAKGEVSDLIYMSNLTSAFNNVFDVDSNVLASGLTNGNVVVATTTENSYEIDISTFSLGDI
jgi:hypothetical protein